MSYIETNVINEYYCSIVDEQTGLDNLYSGITKLYNRVTDQDRMIHTLECALSGSLYRICQIKMEIENLKKQNRIIHVLYVNSFFKHQIKSI